MESAIIYDCEDLSTAEILGPIVNFHAEFGVVNAVEPTDEEQVESKDPSLNLNLSGVQFCLTNHFNSIETNEHINSIESVEPYNPTESIDHFNSNEFIETSIDSIEPTDLLKCTQIGCKAKFPQKEHLIEHYLKKHSVTFNRRFSTPQSSNQLKNHSVVVEKFPVLSSSGDPIDEYRYRLLSANGTPTGNWCIVCRWSNCAKLVRRNGLCLDHLGEKANKCPVKGCNKMLGSEYTLKQHQRVHFKRHKCPGCKKKLKTLTYLHSHKKICKKMTKELKNPVVVESDSMGLDSTQANSIELSSSPILVQPSPMVTSNSQIMVKPSSLDSPILTQQSLPFITFQHQPNAIIVQQSPNQFNLIQPNSILVQHPNQIMSQPQSNFSQVLIQPYSMINHQPQLMHLQSSLIQPNPTFFTTQQHTNIVTYQLVQAGNQLMIQPVNVSSPMESYSSSLIMQPNIVDNVPNGATQLTATIERTESPIDDQIDHQMKPLEQVESTLEHDDEDTISLTSFNLIESDDETELQSEPTESRPSSVAPIESRIFQCNIGACRLVFNNEPTLMRHEQNHFKEIYCSWEGSDKNFVRRWNYRKAMNRGPKPSVALLNSLSRALRTGNCTCTFCNNSFLDI